MNAKQWYQRPRRHRCENTKPIYLSGYLPTTTSQTNPSMDASASAGGGGPAPFLIKTYDMVDDSSTDEIVSWSAAKSSFVVWNPPEFARLLLPTYFKHNNFSSFIRQLNTYGFRKIDPEKWEFANEEFIKDQKHLLKNIHRRKPIHSHSNPQSSMVDPERAAFEEEIERLSREKASLEANVLSFRQQRSAEKLQLEDMMQRVGGMEQRQENLLTFLQKAVKNPSFAERLAHKIESMDFSAYNKKRRLPRVDHTQAIAENSFIDDLSASRPETGSIFHQDFSSKLRLELSPTVSDINVISQSTQSSNEGGGSPRRKLSQGDPKDAHLRKESILCAPETLELSDTGTSFTFRMDPSLPRKVPASDLPRLHVLQQGLTTSNDEGDGHMSCQLNLTLASSSLQANRSPVSSKVPQFSQEMSKSSESKFSNDVREPDIGALVKNRLQADEDANVSSSHKVPNNNQGSAAPPVRVNDVFWEQFLTERPGSSDNEEASSNYRANPYEEQEDRRSGYGMSRSTRNMEQLTL